MAADEGSSIQLGSKMGTAAYDDGRLQLLYFVCIYFYIICMVFILINLHVHIYIYIYVLLMDVSMYIYIELYRCISGLSTKHRAFDPYPFEKLNLTGE